MKKLLKLSVAAMLAYAFLAAAFYVAMSQKPGTFSKVMAHTPTAVFIVFPFQSMWLSARKGALEAGDLAPDFNLEEHRKTSKVRLSSFRGQKPVVLVFGSYT